MKTENENVCTVVLYSRSTTTTTLLLLLRTFRTNFDFRARTTNGKHHYGDGVEVVSAAAESITWVHSPVGRKVNNITLFTRYCVPAAVAAVATTYIK